MGWFGPGEPKPSQVPASTVFFPKKLVLCSNTDLSIGIVNNFIKQKNKEKMFFEPSEHVEKSSIT